MSADKSSDALAAYRAKRDFSVTSEPAEGGEANDDQRAFVIQKHWATRLHYDLRLEIAGTMKSWAVPKGPSLDPQDKRMAVQVEDHPISYNAFEGEIPKGQYGAGKVIVWDRGTWLPEGDPERGWSEGKLKFELRGHKLAGHWTLVRMKGRGSEKQPPWLLIKEKDASARPSSEFSVTEAMPDSVSALGPPPGADARTTHVPALHAARETAPQRGKRPTTKPSTAEPSRTDDPGPPAGAVPAPLPESLSPQLATLADGPPPDEDAWVYEVKFDGYRILARCEGGQVALITRNKNDWTAKLPHLKAALEACRLPGGLPDGWYDGEIVVAGDDGAGASFQALQRAFETTRTQRIAYYLFDVPYCAGHDLRGVPLHARRHLARQVVQAVGHPSVRFSDDFPETDVREVVAAACRLGLEGVIAKRRDSRYGAGRSRDWLKLKCGLRQEFVVVGWTDPQGTREHFGALLLAVHDAAGALTYAGNVGTGFDSASLESLFEKMRPLATDHSPVGKPKDMPRKPHWIRPELVAEIAFAEWTEAGRVRQAVFQGLREDKPPSAIVRETAVHMAVGAARSSRSGTGTGTGTGAAKSRRAAKARGGAKPAAAVALPATLRVTHPERVVDAASGATKLDVVTHYAAVAGVMMEHLKDRPLALLRAPDGVAGEQFFQKHSERFRFKGIDLLDPALDAGHAPLMAVATPEGLLSGAQMNVIEWHTWNGVKHDIGRPDRIVFDIDPGEGVAWPQVREAATLTRALLKELGLECFLKTSGGKGLHVVVPIVPGHDWDTVKDFSHAVVTHMARTIPQRFVDKAGPQNRVGKIFIDYLRNGFGATTVCAWSLRARPGLGVSVPVAWDELAALESAAAWTLETVAERISAVGNAPWTGYAKAATALDAAMKTLGR